MEQNKTSLTGIIRLAVFTILITLAVIGLWLVGWYVAAAIAGTATVAFYLLLIVLATSYITRKNTIETMRIGAEIALKAQQINDSWDARKTKAMSDLVREGMRLGNNPQLPAPPLSGNWLELPNSIDAEFTEDN